MRQYVLGALIIVAIVIISAYVLPYRTYFTTEQMSPNGEFGGVSLRMEYAATDADLERGFSGRDNIDPDVAMLFVFSKDDKYGFWMKDMLVPLDIFWLDSQGQVVHIAQDVATSTYPDVFYPPIPARYVLETVAGFAQKNNIKIGTQLRLKKSPIVSE